MSKRNEHLQWTKKIRRDPPATLSQRMLLKRLGAPAMVLSGLTSHDASLLIQKIFKIKPSQINR